VNFDCIEAKQQYTIIEKIFLKKTQVKKVQTYIVTESLARAAMMIELLSITSKNTVELASGVGGTKTGG